MWTSFSFITQKLRRTEQRYSTFEQELLAVFLAVKHLKNFPQGQQLFIVTGQKPLTYSIKSGYSNASPLEILHQAYVAGYATDVRYIIGALGITPDALFRLDLNNLSTI